MSTQLLNKLMGLRRDIRKLEQEAEYATEQAKSPLTTEEAATRLINEAGEKHRQAAIKRQEIQHLTTTQQLRLL